MLRLVLGVIVIGLVATAMMDSWLFLWSRLRRTPFPNFGNTIGRWVYYLKSGRFAHQHIGLVAPYRHELALGWIVHYAVGVSFAVLLILVAGTQWMRQPHVGIALVVGLATVAFGWFILHPAIGLGFGTSKAPNPWAARLQTIAGHSIFGLGLYLGGLVNLLLDAQR